MKVRVNLKTCFGALLVAIAFSESLKAATTWLYPFIVFSLLIFLYSVNILSGHSIKYGTYIFKKYFFLGILPYLIILVYTIVLIRINHQGMMFVNRALGSIFIAMMTLVVCATLVYMFKEKTPDVLCYGLIINYILHVMISFGKVGLKGFIQHIVDPLNTYQSVFELHSTAFALNLLLIYYLMKRDKKCLWKIVSCIVIMYLIMKRISFAGTILALIVYFLTDFIFQKWEKQTKYYVVLITLFLSAYVYVGLIRLYPDLFKLLSIRFGILNRSLMVDSLSKYYSYHPSYLGKGFGFVSVMMPSMDIAGATVAALHNDVLKDFIEEGFIGFGLIYYYIFVVIPMKISKKKTNNSLCCLTLLLVYTFVTLLADNVLDYVSFTCTLFTLFGVIHLYGDQIFEPQDKVQRSLKTFKQVEGRYWQSREEEDCEQ